MGILGELWVKLGLKNDGLKKGLNDSKKEVSGFASSIKKLGGIIGAAFSVKAILDFTHQTAELANKAAGVKKAFDKLNSPGLLADLRRATMGTVDDLQLMQRAVQANNFKIPLNQLAKYLEFATAQASATGQSVDYLVDSIILGLGRKSLPILDNLGFSAAEIREKMKDGGDMADAVGRIIAERMESGALAIDETALATQRLTAAWTNFQMAVGEGTKGPWNEIKTEVANALNWAVKVLKNRKLFSPMGLGASLVASAYYADELNTNTESATDTTTQIQEEVIAVKGLIEQYKEEISAKEQLRDLSANEDEIRQLNDEIAAMKEKLKVLQMSTEEYKKYRNEQMKPIPEMQSDLSGIFDTKFLEENTNKGVKILDNAAQQWKQKTIELNEEAIAQQQVTLEAISSLNNAINAGVTASLSELANVIGGVENANVGSVISALLSPLADACISAGLLIMTTGEGIEAMKASLISFFGGSAIAAGAAMMAIGTAAKAGLAAIGKNAASGGYSNQAITSYSGGYGVNTANYSQSANDYTLTTTLKGQDLLLSIERTQNNKRR